jgi:radical SAM superfamily enzyme
MAREYASNPEHFHLFTADEYIELVLEFISRLRKDVYIDRFVSQSPKELLIAPDWGLKNHEFADKIRK